MIQEGICPADYLHPNGRLTRPRNWLGVKQHVVRPRNSLRKGDEQVDPNFDARFFMHWDKFSDIGWGPPLTNGITAAVYFLAGADNLVGPHVVDDMDPITPLFDGIYPLDSAYDGTDGGSINPNVRHALRDVLCPSTEPGHDDPQVVAPNFFFLLDARDASPAVAEREAAYLGALGVRAITALRGFRHGNPVSNALVVAFTVTYTRRWMRLFAHHVSGRVRPRARPEQGERPTAWYHMNMLGKWSLRESHETSAGRRLQSAMRGSARRLLGTRLSTTPMGPISINRMCDRSVASFQVCKCHFRNCRLLTANVSFRLSSFVAPCLKEPCRAFILLTMLFLLTQIVS